jgi:hypothetical protein
MSKDLVDGRPRGTPLNRMPDPFTKHSIWQCIEDEQEAGIIDEAFDFAKLGRGLLD